MTLLSPYYIFLALLLFVLCFSLKKHPIESSWYRVIPTPVLQFLGINNITTKAWPWRLILATTVALALFSPATRITQTQSMQHSNGWLILADVSRSMTTDDILPSRLSAMRTVIQQLAQHANARPLSLIVYAGDAFLAVPPATDQRVFNENTALLDYGVVPVDGSNVTRALSLATSVIRDAGYLHARVFILSDSGGMSSSSDAAARHLAQLGHQVDVIAFGSTQGSVDVATSMEAVSSLAIAGHGKHLTVNAFGDVQLSALLHDATPDNLQNAAMRALYWKNQSHWLLLLALPLALALFNRSQPHV